MKIYIHEITDQETQLEFTHEKDWVRSAIERVDERIETSDEKDPFQGLRRAFVQFNLRKVDEVIVISGQADTSVQMVCSRCANSFKMPLDPHFSALFCKDPVMAGIGHLEKAGKPAGQNRGFARHAHDQELGIPGRDLDITYLSQDYIDLGEILTEQLRLQVPFQPLCQEACRGICSHCGADLNIGRCACSKLNAPRPFSVLRDMKL